MGNIWRDILFCTFWSYNKKLGGCIALLQYKYIFKRYSGKERRIKIIELFLVHLKNAYIRICYQKRSIRDAIKKFFCRHTDVEHKVILDPDYRIIQDPCRGWRTQCLIVVCKKCDAILLEDDKFYNYYKINFNNNRIPLQSCNPRELYEALLHPPYSYICARAYHKRHPFLFREKK